MNLRDLEYLVAVADHGHFGKAAAACFVSQPTLSTQLRKLEHELGVTLVERGPRSNLLTPVGEQVVAQARGVLEGVATIEGLAARARDPRTGRLRLGIFPTLAPYLLPHVVPALHARLPDVVLQLVEAKSAQLLEDLRHGRLDAAVIAAPLTDPVLATAPLFREDFLLAVPRSHPLAADAGPLPLADLAGEELLLLDEGHCLRDQALAVCGQAQADEAEGFRATSLETLRHMVATGGGVTLLPRLAVLPPVPANDAVALREFTDPAPSRELLLVWRAASGRDDVMAEVADALRSGVAGVVAG